MSGRIDRTCKYNRIVSFKSYRTLDPDQQDGFAGTRGVPGYTGRPNRDGTVDESGVRINDVGGRQICHEHQKFVAWGALPKEVGGVTRLVVVVVPVGLGSTGCVAFVVVVAPDCVQLTVTTINANKAR